MAVQQPQAALAGPVQMSTAGWQLGKAGKSGTKRHSFGARLSPWSGLTQPLWPCQNRGFQGWSTLRAGCKNALEHSFLECLVPTTIFVN